MYNSVKDTNKILEEERRRNVVKALIVHGCFGVPSPPEVHKISMKCLPQPNNWSEAIVVELYYIYNIHLCMSLSGKFTDRKAGPYAYKYLAASRFTSLTCAFPED